MISEDFFNSNRKNKIAPNSPTIPKTEIIEDFVVNQVSETKESKKNRFVELILRLFRKTKNNG